MDEHDHDHCPICSALVSDLEVHRNWHGELDEALELAVRQQAVAPADGAPHDDVQGGTV